MGDGTALYCGRTALRLTRRAVLLSAAALPLAGCWLFPAEWHEKLTVTISTPKGDVSGSSVRWQKLTEDMLLNRANRSFGGEAVVVEVARGKYLFALLDSHKPQAELIFFPGEPPLKSTHRLDDVKGQVIDVPPSHYPMLVTFGNINDPKTVKQVLPNAFATTFGSGYALKSITLEITDEPATKGAVEKALPWIQGYFDRMFDGRSTHTSKAENRLANDL